MKTVKVKICGITREEDLAIAVDSGVDAVGFVVGVPSSPRNLTLEKAKKLMKQVPLFVDSVAVTISNDLHSLIKIYEKLKPNVVQIHGENIPKASTIRKKLRDVPLIRAIHVKDNVIQTAMETSSSFDAILLDTFVKGKCGGTGVAHNWELSKNVREVVYPKPLILAGGLTPKNVEDAIRLVKPYAVDVSSGVELRLGVKDPRKTFEFVKNAKKVNL